LLEAPKAGGVVTQSEETSCFRFKQPRWMWSQLVPAPLETVAAGLDPLIYAADNAWNQLKECRAAKGSCESLDKTYLKAVEARDKVWKDDSTIHSFGTSEGSPARADLRSRDFPRIFKSTSRVGSFSIRAPATSIMTGEKTTGEHLIAPGEALQKILEQQQLLAEGAAKQARDETGPAKPEAAHRSVASEKPTSEKPAQVPRPVQPEATHTPGTREAAARPSHKRHAPARLEARSSDDRRHGRRTVARREPADRTQPIPQVSPLARLEPRFRVFSNRAAAPASPGFYETTIAASGRVTRPRRSSLCVRSGATMKPSKNAQAPHRHQAGEHARHIGRAARRPCNRVLDRCHAS
jgi:hypothetical protein